MLYGMTRPFPNIALQYAYTAMQCRYLCSASVVPKKNGPWMVRKYNVTGFT